MRQGQAGSGRVRRGEVGYLVVSGEGDVRCGEAWFGGVRYGFVWQGKEG